VTGVDVRAEIRAILAEHVDVPASDDDELGLPSFVVIALAEELEARHRFVVAARELSADNFSTVARIAAFVERKRA
jgi:acyl carrier protein